MPKIRKLRSLIFLKYDSEAALAKNIGWTRQKLNKITCGVKEPDINELNELSIALNESIEEIAKIFLNKKSPNGQQND